MFFPGSRYISSPQYNLTLKDRTIVPLVKAPTPGAPVVLGYYRRQTGDRLDQIAARFLGDATQFWRICDANGAMVTDALAARPLVGVPLNATRGG